MKMQIMNEHMEENKKLKEKEQSEQKAIEQEKVRITDLSVAPLFQRFYPQTHRNIEQNHKIAATVKNQTHHHIQFVKRYYWVFKGSGVYFSYNGRFLEIFEKIDYRKNPLKKVSMLEEQRFLKKTWDRSPIEKIHLQFCKRYLWRRTMRPLI